ncbi:hypothetical protein [Amycolatopsis orientalis]|uniref:hypothetical protein n=1 Tax=Amycolatopsis orientalis TaxID=31958 RepID=UPI00055D9872|nr:hypothetical protein [Amycolatopsis orientalis]
MSEVLYKPAVNPPERVLHHALLYRDGIATLAPDDDPLAHLDTRVRCAHEAGLYRPLPTGSLWRNPRVLDALQEKSYHAVVQDEVRELVLRGKFEPRWGQTYDCWMGKDRLVAGDIRARDARDQAAALVDSATVRIGVVQAAWTGGCYVSGWDFYPVMCSGSRPLTSVDREVMVRTANILSELENESGTAPMFVACFGPELVDVDRWIGSEGRNDVLLNVDVGRILPDPRPGIDTAALIRFRQKYDDERRRLIVAVERLVEQLTQTYSEPRHVERAVRREISDALADMCSAGRSVLRGWSKRLVSVVIATGSTATAMVASGTSPVLTVLGSVGAGIAVNKASEPIQNYLRNPRSDTYRYLHRIGAAQA